MNLAQKFTFIGMLLGGIAVAAENAPSSSSATTAATQPLPHIYGVFMQHARNIPVEQEFLENKNLTGISLGTYWSNLEPKENEFHWEYLDAQIKAIKAHHKFVDLRVFAGNYTPQWLFDKGIPCMTYVNNDQYEKMQGITQKTPIPWDPTYLATWQKMIRALGARYQDQVDVINVTGPNRTTAETGLSNWQNPKPDEAKWESLGYTPEKLIGAWERCMDTFAAAFPHSQIAFNTSERGVKADSVDGVVSAVAAYGVQKLGRRFSLQNNALAASTPKRSDFTLISKYANQIPIGYQMLWVVYGDKTNRMKGSLRQAIDNGLKLHARYLEIYKKDILEYPADIQYAADQLKP